MKIQLPIQICRHNQLVLLQSALLSKNNVVVFRNTRTDLHIRPPGASPMQCKNTNIEIQKQTLNSIIPCIEYKQTKAFGKCLLVLLLFSFEDIISGVTLVRSLHIHTLFLFTSSKITTLT